MVPLQPNIKEGRVKREKVVSQEPLLQHSYICVFNGLYKNYSTRVDRT